MLSKQECSVKIKKKMSSCNKNRSMKSVRVYITYAWLTEQTNIYSVTKLVVNVHYEVLPSTFTPSNNSNGAIVVR